MIGKVVAQSLFEEAAAEWLNLPAAQQPEWRHHRAYQRSQLAMRAAAPLVTGGELDELRRCLARVAVGEAQVMQVGDCAESFFECTHAHTHAKLETLNLLGDRFQRHTGRPVVRIGRIGGQFAKPRSQPTERHGDLELPSFRGHLVNSEVPTRAARHADPRRMLWAYQASARVLAWVNAHREVRAELTGASVASGPWSSHEALIVDYEAGLTRTDTETGERLLTSTHFPWIGERTRQPDSAHVRLLAAVTNPVGCKVGPTASIAEVLELCTLLDPERTPGRLVLIARMGHNRVAEALPDLVDAVHRAGHPVVWLCDPMHGNTVRAPGGTKTRYLSDVIAEARQFQRVLERQGRHPGGLHLEVAADDVTECIGGAIDSPALLATRYTSLCDPRLNPEQAIELVDALG